MFPLALIGSTVPTAIEVADFQQETVAHYAYFRRRCKNTSTDQRMLSPRGEQKFSSISDLFMPLTNNGNMVSLISGRRFYDNLMFYRNSLCPEQNYMG